MRQFTPEIIKQIQQEETAANAIALQAAKQAKGSCGNCKCAQPPQDTIHLIPLARNKRRYCISKERYVHTYNICENWQGV